MSETCKSVPSFRSAFQRAWKGRRTFPFVAMQMTNFGFSKAITGQQPWLRVLGMYDSLQEANEDITHFSKQPYYHFSTVSAPTSEWIPILRSESEYKNTERKTAHVHNILRAHQWLKKLRKAMHTPEMAEIMRKNAHWLGSIMEPFRPPAECACTTPTGTLRTSMGYDVCEGRAGYVSYQKYLRALRDKTQDAEVAAKTQDAEVAAKAQDAEVAAKTQGAEVAAKAQDAEVAAKTQDAEVAAKTQDAEVAAKAQGTVHGTEGHATFAKSFKGHATLPPDTLRHATGSRDSNILVSIARDITVDVHLWRGPLNAFVRKHFEGVVEPVPEGLRAFPDDVRRPLFMVLPFVVSDESMSEAHQHLYEKVQDYDTVSFTPWSWQCMTHIAVGDGTQVKTHEDMGDQKARQEDEDHHRSALPSQTRVESIKERLLEEDDGVEESKARTTMRVRRVHAGSEVVEGLPLSTNTTHLDLKMSKAKRKSARKYAAELGATTIPVSTRLQKLDKGAPQLTVSDRSASADARANFHDKLDGAGISGMFDEYLKTLEKAKTEEKEKIEKREDEIRRSVAEHAAS